MVRLNFGALVTSSTLLIALTSCDERPDQWDAFVYPGDDLFTHEEIRGLKTFELCREAAQERLFSLRADGGGDYECGYRCEPLSPASDTKVCEETRK